MAQVLFSKKEENTRVPGEGIEPSWDKSHWFLRPACIPFQHPGAVACDSILKNTKFVPL